MSTQTMTANIKRAVESALGTFQFELVFSDNGVGVEMLEAT